MHLVLGSPSSWLPDNGYPLFDSRVGENKAIGLSTCGFFNSSLNQFTFQDQFFFVASQLKLTAYA